MAIPVLSLTGIKLIISRTPGGSRSVPTELRELMESKVISLISYMTGVLHTAMISTVEVIVNVISE